MIARPGLPASLLFLLVAFAAAAVPHTARAQDAARAQDGALSGTVTDATGLVLPGVTVEARSAPSAGPARTVVSDAAGRFTIPALRPGTYDVTFTLSGFGTEVRRGVVVGPAAATTLDVVLAAQFEERVVVVGSRAQPRSVTASTVPIDAIPYEDVARQGSTDVGDQLRAIVPSYNVNPQPVGDAARLIRPANLRSLAPDHTLVLVNGRRRHRGAVITWIGNGVADGAQGPDISTIPAIALRQIEVLRDGAAAQYGSDAIAGVLNFLLKDDRGGGSLELHTGGFGAGDGGTYTVAGNAGLPLGRAGFANLSVEYGNAGRTSRSVQRDDAALLIAAGNDAVADPAQIWGSPRIDDNVKLWGNFGHLFASGVQAYGHANYASRRVASGFFFRNPNTRAAVFSADRGADPADRRRAPAGGLRRLRRDDDGKLSGRYRLGGAVALRASASSGFRAPTPGQQNAFNVSTEYDHALMDLVNNGTIPSTSRVAELRGGEPLQPERSVSYALGAVVEAGPFSLTADYFRIRLSDRLALTQLFALTPPEVDGLLAEGVTRARNLQNFRFFTNHFETLTQGLDLVATYAPPRLGGRTTFGFLFNRTATAVTRFDPAVLDALRIRELTGG